MGEWIIGIEIGSYQIKLIEVFRKNNKLSIHQFSLIKVKFKAFSKSSKLYLL